MGPLVLQACLGVVPTERPATTHERHNDWGRAELHLTQRRIWRLVSPRQRLTPVVSTLTVLEAKLEFRSLTHACTR